MKSPGVLSVILTGITSKQARLATERLLQEIRPGRAWRKKKLGQQPQDANHARARSMKNDTCGICAFFLQENRNFFLAIPFTSSG